MKRFTDNLSYIKTPKKLSFRHPDIMGDCFILKTAKGDWKAVADFYFGKYGYSRKKHQIKKRFDNEAEAHSYLFECLDRLFCECKN